MRNIKSVRETNRTDTTHVSNHEEIEINSIKRLLILVAFSLFKYLLNYVTIIDLDYDVSIFSLFRNVATIVRFLLENIYFYQNYFR